MGFDVGFWWLGMALLGLVLSLVAGYSVGRSMVHRFNGGALGLGPSVDGGRLGWVYH